MNRTLLFEMFRLNQSPIGPVPAGACRPKWSVMIPTFNCARYLRKTLESVLKYGPTIPDVQIEVVDDCSTDDDPAAVVSEIDDSRITFYRQTHNVGATENFNTCIRRSRGHLVHILHGDDFVLPEFYDEIERLYGQSPSAGLYATRIIYCDEDGFYDMLSTRFKRQILDKRDIIDLMSNSNPFQFAGVVVQRSVYEALGGFSHDLLHVADWEMWTRIAASYEISLSNKALACYRIFSASDSSNLARTAENLRDLARFEEMVEKHGNLIDSKRLSFMITAKALAQTRHFQSLGLAKETLASYLFWKRRVGIRERLLFSARSLLRDLIRR